VRQQNSVRTAVEDFILPYGIPQFI